MPKRKIIIDGYNLIKANPVIFRRMPDLESQRLHLQKILQSLPAWQGQELLIIFDGASDQLLPGWDKHSRMKIIFSGKTREADQVIQELIRKKNSQDNLLIVSSDRAILNTAEDHQVATLTAQQFWKGLSAAAPPSPDPADQESGSERSLSPKEVQDWLKLFKEREKNRSED